MFANEYQGGPHVEVLGTQGQNPLAQWKVSGPQKGVQKVYDKALKGYVFVSTGACRMALPKDDRSTLGLMQPHLLLQLEVGVGTPFSVEVGLSDASATRRRIILSSSFSELKCTPLHCQVPFTCLPRECWLNLVLPVAELAVVLFKGGGGGAAAAAPGSNATALAGAAAGGGSFSPSGGPAAAVNTSYRTLDSLQVAGTCRLRRICTLREAPQPSESQDAGTATAAAASAKPLEFPVGVDYQTLLLDPRSLTLVGINGTGGGSPSQTMTLGGSGAAGAGLGIVGTSMGSSRRPANGGAASPLPGVNSRSSPNPGSKGGGGGATTAAAAPNGCSWEEDGGAEIGTQQGSVASAVPNLHAGDTPTRGSSSGASTPTARAGGGVPTLPPAFGAAPGPIHHGFGSSDHVATQSRLGRSTSGCFNVNNNGSGSPTPPQTGAVPGPASGPGSTCGSGPLPSLDPSTSVSAASGGGSAGGGGGGMKLPRLQPSGGGSAAAAAAAATTTGPSLPSSGGAGPAASPSGEDASRGDTSPFGSRRALSAQTPPRQSGSATPPGSAGGTGSAAAGGGGCGGKPPASPWSGSASSKRAQSGPARISTEALAQNNSQIPPTISENEVVNPSSTGMLAHAVKSPVRSPSRARPQPANAAAVSGGHTVAAASITAGASAGGASTTNSSGLRSGGGSGSIEPPSPALPQLRHIRAEAAAAAAAAAREAPASPAGLAIGASNANLSSHLSSVLTIRGGMDASIDFGAHSHLLEGSPGSSAILSSNLRISSVSSHTHRYGGGAAAVVPPGASIDALSDSDADSGVPSPSGAAGAAVTAAVGCSIATADAVAAKAPRTRTRVLQGGGAAAGGGGKGTAAPDGANGRSLSTPASVSNSPALHTRKGTGHGSDVETPTRTGRGGLSSAVSQNGHNSPANTPSRSGGGRTTPLPSGGGGGGAGAGIGLSNLGPGANSGRARKEDGAANGRPSATAAGATAVVSGGGVGGAGSASGGRPNAAGSSGGGVSAAGKQPGSGAGSVCSSPARQRPAPPSSATRGSTKPSGGGSGAASATPNEHRDRLPPLSTAAGGRGRGSCANGGRSGGGAAATASATPGGGGGRGKAMAGRSICNRRPTTSNEVDVEESITLNAGLWGGFGVDEDDDMLGSRHFRNGACASSGSDGELGGGGGGNAPSLRRGVGGGGGAGSRSSLIRRASHSSSPDLPGGCGGASEDLPSPPDHYTNAASNGLLSPPIRCSNGAAMGTSQDVGPAFAGFPAPASRRRSSAAGDSGGGNGLRPNSTRHVLDSLLDEEALLAGHVRDLDHYDDWAKVDQRPTPPELLHAHRAFTPPVVPASKALGVSIEHSRSNSGRVARGGGGGGGAAFASAANPATVGDAQVLRVSPTAAEAAAGRGGGPGKGVVLDGGGEAMLDLVYDPILNCYYDGATGRYYELKT
ncbi:hypothetical protein Vretimale_11292 [Volvox reticuliferus]|uniref:CFA20 domain-containing protein n=1 Tax=Volvox reticuliferus TaxID=1737510 RepID=A0A8J4GH34_9CHLO|nr:hypothetical protein Vretimale_11292 [Volvox reticuliferus]